MISLRPSQERGQTKLDWLDSFHSFSFGDYYDPKHHHFGSLRVINEDWIEPGKGFGTHGHRDMEIITYVVSGQLAHKDSMGNEFMIQAGDVQRMTAGTGVEHSEFNASDTDPVHLFQMWVYPNEKGLAPGYEQKALVNPKQLNTWQYLASSDGQHGSVAIHQDATIAQAYMAPNTEMAYPAVDGRKIWVQVVSGEVTIANTYLKAGDGLALVNEPCIIHANELTEVLLFDIAD